MLMRSEVRERLSALSGVLTPCVEALDFALEYATPETQAIADGVVAELDAAVAGMRAVVGMLETGRQGGQGPPPPRKRRGEELVPSAGLDVV